MKNEPGISNRRDARLDSRFGRPRLELNPQRELKDAGLRYRTGALAEGVAVDELGVFVATGYGGGSNGGENWMIQNVESLSAERKFEAFADIQIL